MDQLMEASGWGGRWGGGSIMCNGGANVLCVCVLSSPIASPHKLATKYKDELPYMPLLLTFCLLPVLRIWIRIGSGSRRAKMTKK